MNYLARSNIAGAALLLAVAGPAHATLIGDTVGIDIQPNGTFWSTSTASAVVGPGIEATLSLQGSPFFSLDIGAASIVMTEIGNPFGIPFGFGANEVLRITDMNWVGAPGRIVGFNINTVGWSGIDATDVTFTDDSVTLAFDSGASIEAAGAVLNIDLLVEHVPEPGTLALLALGLAGVAGLRRRRRER